jgi:hypothetical protein
LRGEINDWFDFGRITSELCVDNVLLLEIERWRYGKVRCGIEQEEERFLNGEEKRFI